MRLADIRKKWELMAAAATTEKEQNWIFWIRTKAGRMKTEVILKSGKRIETLNSASAESKT